MYRGCCYGMMLQRKHFHLMLVIRCKLLRNDAAYNICRQDHASHVCLNYDTQEIVTWIFTWISCLLISCEVLG